MAQVEQAGIPGMEDWRAAVDVDALVFALRANPSERDEMFERLTDEELKHFYCCALQHLTARKAERPPIANRKLRMIKTTKESNR